MAIQRYWVTPHPIETLLSRDSYPLWSPYGSFEAVNALLAALNKEQQHV
jgi:hypothetical protein